MPRTTGADNKTQPTSKDVKAYLDSVPHEGRREDADLLLNMMTRITGEPAVLWGPSIMPGFGPYDSLLSKLGSYKTGRSCLYLGRLSNVDVHVLEDIVAQSVALMKERYQVD